MSKIIIPLGQVGSTGVYGRGFMSTQDRIALGDAIISIFQQDPEPMSLRYVYYRCISGELNVQVPKSSAEYERISEIVLELRASGRLDPSFIYDGKRDFNPTATDESSPWHKADMIPLVVVESDSAAGMVQVLTDEYQVGLTSLSGQPSYTVKDLIGDWINKQSKPVLLIYLGDYDKSGFDIPNELQSFLADACPHNEPELLRLAITKETIEQFSLSQVQPKKPTAEWPLTTELESLSKLELRQLVQDQLDKILPEGALERSNQMLFAEDYREALLRRWGLMIETALRNDESMPDKDDFLLEARYVP